jgi:hypothetical protein
VKAVSAISLTGAPAPGRIYTKSIGSLICMVLRQQTILQ